MAFLVKKSPYFDTENHGRLNFFSTNNTAKIKSAYVDLDF